MLIIGITSFSLLSKMRVSKQCDLTLADYEKLLPKVLKRKHVCVSM